MIITFLGSGTSGGIPIPTCKCLTCSSKNSKNKRLRSSLWIRSKETSILIDCGPDFREQCLRAEIPHLDAVYITHSHFDHIAGIDDLKPYTWKNPLRIMGSHQTYQSLLVHTPYNFTQDNSSGSGKPSLSWETITHAQEIKIKDISLLPLEIKHGSLFPLGFRIKNTAYLLDCKEIPEKSLQLLKNLDTLIITGLREGRTHPNHLTIEEAITYAEQLKPKKTYFSHISHEVEHEYVSKRLPTNKFLAFDGLSLEIT